MKDEFRHRPPLIKKQVDAEAVGGFLILIAVFLAILVVLSALVVGIGAAVHYGLL